MRKCLPVWPGFTQLQTVCKSALVSARLSTLRIYVSLSSWKVDVKLLWSAVIELLIFNISVGFKLFNLLAKKIVNQYLEFNSISPDTNFKLNRFWISIDLRFKLVYNLADLLDFDLRMLFRPGVNLYGAKVSK